MTRFTVSLLLVTSLLLSQLAAAPHMHAADVHHTSPHGGQPHFHLHRFLPAADEDAPAPAPAGEPVVRHDCPYDHDADACYLPDTTGELGGRAKADPDAALAPLAPPPSAADADFRAARATRARQYDIRPPECPLYIRHLALLN